MPYIFNYRGKQFQIESQSSLVLLYTGELIGLGWTGQTPTVAQIPVVYLTLSKDWTLAEIASAIGAVPGIEVITPKVKACPNFGHGIQTGNFCSECGTPTVFIPYTAVMEPISKLNFSLTIPVKVQGSGPCPNCKKVLSNAVDHGSPCPHCGQALHWTCS